MPLRSRSLIALLLTLLAWVALAASAGVPIAAAQEAVDPVVATSDPNDPWALADALITRIDADWQPRREVYLDRGNVSIRANAMLLELHALAALAGHDGPARQDARLPGLVRFFTTAPVVVYKTKTKRGTANFPHTPAWESVYRADSERATLHPSADAIIARSLAAAWRARDVAAIPLEDSQRIQKVVGEVARGWWYKAPRRAENQINWNADLYASNLEVNGDRRGLPEYRAHLKWFVDHAFKRAYKGGSSNLSSGYGFRYLPQHKGGSANAVDTVEYANLVHSALGHYTSFVRAGMRPLNGGQIARLRAWSRHILLGTWTHAGYLNWDSGLGTSRRHIRQYWGFALDSLVRSAGPGALLGTASQRNHVRFVAERGLRTFRQSAWDGSGPLPKATSFDAPNGFPSGTRSSVITVLRFAIVGAALDVRLPSASPRSLGNVYSHDREMGRLAVSTPRYNAAVIKPVAQQEGGIDLVRLFDGYQRPLMTLGGASSGGAAAGVRLQRGGSALLDVQTGSNWRWKVPSSSVASNRRNRAGTFSSLQSTATMRGDGKSSVTVRHRFTGSAITTNYTLRRGKATAATVRVPVWGRQSKIEILRGGKVSGKQIKRTSGALLLRATTIDGAKMLIALRGVPSRARIVVASYGKSPKTPQGAREFRVRFALKGTTRIQRRIAVVPAAG